MAYTRDKGREFWFDFDNQARFSAAWDAAYQKAYFDHGLHFDPLMDALRASFGSPDHPKSFQNVILPAKQGFAELAELQLNLMDAHLGDDASIQSAFEDFGQGVLFDDRRPAGIKVHMMDGTPDDWVGYHRWHAFARAAALSGADARWLHIDRCIGLAWAIQTEANPTVDSQTNPGLAANRLASLRQSWLSLPFEKLDWAFVMHATRAPDASLLPVWTAAMGRYARVQQLLGDAATDGAPDHVGSDGNAHGRFWELPYAQFMALPPIYEYQLIADPGLNRGERSNLVKVLKGPLSEPGKLTVPRMPRFRPPMSAADIKFIQDWIDADCPEI